jgi:hypothetical protein
MIEPPGPQHRSSDQPSRLRRFGRLLAPLLLVLVAIKIGWYALVVGGFPFIPARNDQPARAAVVAQIERGVLPVGTDGHVELPLGSADLSIGGFVRTYPNVDHGGRAILFVTTLGAVDRYTGYIYSPQETPPDDDPMGGGGLDVEPLDNGWFAVTAA